jgi:hypothetical protein
VMSIGDCRCPLSQVEAQQGAEDSNSGKRRRFILETSVDDTRALRQARCAGCSGRTEVQALGEPKKSRSAEPLEV